jgi:membrane protease subunit HflC
MHLESHDHSHEHNKPHASAHDHSHGQDHDHAHPHSHRGSPRNGPWSNADFLRTFWSLLVILPAGLLIYTSCFFVDQTEYVYVTEFGRPVRLCEEPGMELKMPYQSVRRLDRRLQMYGPSGSQMLTRDQPRGVRGSEPAAIAQQGSSLGGPTLSIDWFVCWRLPTRAFTDSLGKPFEPSVLKFVQSVGSITGAQDRLRERIDAILKAKVGQMSLSEFVSLEPKDLRLEKLNRELTEQIRSDAIDQFGIEVVDVRIKRFNHPEGVKEAIFAMIRAERQGVAERYRAEGKSEAAKIRSRADTERSQVLSKALADAERIRGEGDAEAMRIANEAHSEDPEFYQLLKTLDTYRTILNEKTTIVLSSESPLLKLLTEGMPRLTSPPKQRQADEPAEDRPMRPTRGGSGTQNTEGMP